MNKAILLFTVAVLIAVCPPALLAQPSDPQFPPDWGWQNGDYYGHWDYPLGTKWPATAASSWSQAGFLAGKITLGGQDCWGVINNSSVDRWTSLTLDIDNYHIPDLTKILWFQYDYYLLSGGLKKVSVEGDIDNDWNTDDVIEKSIASQIVDIGNGWKRVSKKWTLEEQPNREKIIWLDFLAMKNGGKWGLKNVYYSSTCVPEPASFIVWSLLGALGMTVGWWRRRRKAA